MRVGAVALVLGLLVGCFAREANRNYALRVQEVDRQHEKTLDEIESHYAATYDKLVGIQNGAVIETQPGSKTVPLVPVTANRELAALEGECTRLARWINELESLGSSKQEAEISLNQCIRRWDDMHARLLVTTYWAADFVWVLEALKLDPATMKAEPLFVYSHNLRIRAYVEKQLLALNAARMVAKREANDLRDVGIQEAAADRDAEIAEKKRRFALVMAAAAQGFANAQTQSSYTQTSYTQPTSVSGSCTSDFACAIGHRCVKANYSGTGFCARAVNAWGVQEFDLPDMNSVFVKMPTGSDCKMVTDCPAGFTCDLRSGACLR